MSALIWWLHAWGEQQPAPLRGSGGGMTLRPELWRVTIDGQRLENLTDVLAGCVIDWHDERREAIAMAAEIALRDPTRVHPLRDYLAPLLVLSYDDGRPDLVRQVGIFAVDLPREEHLWGQVTATYQGKDLTWILANSVFTDSYTVAAGANLESAMGTITQQAGISRYRYQMGGKTAGRSRTFKPGSSRLRALNRFCKATGRYPVFMDLDGSLQTLPYRSRERSTPWAVYTPADPVGAVTVQPETTERIANVVVVVAERPDGAPITVIRKNTDPASPTSTAALGREIVYGGGPVQDSDIEDQAAAEALADDLLERAGSYYRTVTLRVLPGEPPGLHRTVELRNFVNAGVDLSGKYWLKGWRLGLTPERALVELSLNRLTYLAEGA